MAAILTSPLQSHLRRVCRYPHVRECTLPMRVLAVQCATLKMLQDVTEALQNITERHGAVADILGRYRNVTEALCIIMDVTELYGSVADHYKSIIEPLWNCYRIYQFCPSLIKF